MSVTQWVIILLLSLILILSRISSILPTGQTCRVFNGKTASDTFTVSFFSPPLPPFRVAQWSWSDVGLDDIHGLWCRFLLSADGDVVARLTVPVCVTFRNGGRRAVGCNHFTPIARKDTPNINNNYPRWQLIDKAHLQQSLKAPDWQPAQRRQVVAIPMVRKVQQAALVT